MDNEKDRKIISTSLHQINVEDSDLRKIPIRDFEDLEGYLSELLEEVKNKEQKRQYEFARKTTELQTVLASYYSKNDIQDNESAKSFAEKLLDVEIETDKLYGHLGQQGNGVVKKGSFLQFLYQEDKETYYLGVKIEHQEFIDESDFKKKVGLSIANKVYKACNVKYEKGKPLTVHVYDTNAKTSDYWWNKFLNLKVIRDDALNTREASQAVVRTLATYKKDYPVDYTYLRNAVVTAFKQDKEISYDEFLSNVFENYKSDSDFSEKKLAKLIERLKKLPETKKFDTKFRLIPAEVTFKQVKIPINKDVTVSYNEDTHNLDDKIWREKTLSGKDLVIINATEEGHMQFKLKERAK